MRRVRIKICGVTTTGDAAAAVAAGVDALGLNFYPGSPRHVSPLQARAVVASLPPFVSPVGLFVNEDAAAVMRTVDQTGVQMLQFHGDEEPEYCASFGLPWLKALRVTEGFDIFAEEQRWAGASGLLLDAGDGQRFGGTGQVFDWQLVQGAVEVPILLAGGLNPENVEAAIHTVRPWSVDVSSGVESEPGRKDLARMQAFVAAVRAAECTLG